MLATGLDWLSRHRSREDNGIDPAYTGGRNQLGKGYKKNFVGERGGGSPQVDEKILNVNVINKK